MPLFNSRSGDLSPKNTKTIQLQRPPSCQHLKQVKYKQHKWPEIKFKHAKIIINSNNLILVKWHNVTGHVNLFSGITALMEQKPVLVRVHKQEHQDCNIQI